MNEFALIEFNQRLQHIAPRKSEGGLSALARKANIHPNTVSNWKTRGTVPNLKHVWSLARAANVSPSWLAFGLGPKDWFQAETNTDIEQINRYLSEIMEMVASLQNRLQGRDDEIQLNDDMRIELRHSLNELKSLHRNVDPSDAYINKNIKLISDRISRILEIDA